jgi:hypothetical protein
MVKIFFLTLFSKDKKLIQWFKFLLQPKDLGFEPFLESSFSSMNEMDENKLPFDNILKLIAQIFFFSKRTMFSREQRFKLP